MATDFDGITFVYRGDDIIAAIEEKHNGVFLHPNDISSRSRFFKTIEEAKEYVINEDTINQSDIVFKLDG